MDKGKRIILLIFETCELDTRLTQCEWIDFRRIFREAVNELASRLTHPDPTQKRFRLPPTPAIFFVLSLASVLSLLVTIGFLIIPSLQDIPSYTTFEWESVFVFLLILTPIWGVLLYYFLPLPLHVLKRTYKLRQTQEALALFFALTAFPFAFSGHWAFLLHAIVMLILLFMLQSPGMVRWSGPDGVKIYKRAWRPKIMPAFRPVRVAVDYAQEDVSMAETIIQQLKKVGHIYVDDLQEADIVFVLLSIYKTTSIVNLQKKVVLPVIMQTCKVDKQLSKGQWIDFRQGIRKRDLDTLGRLIVDPSLLLDTLGVIPVKQKNIRPVFVNAAIIIFGFAIISYLFPTVIFFLLSIRAIESISLQNNFGNIGWNFPSTIAALWLYGGVLHSLSTRRGRIRSLRGYVFLASMPLIQILLILTSIVIQPEVPNSTGFGNLMSIIELCCMLPILFPMLSGPRLQVIRLWLPKPSQSAYSKRILMGLLDVAAVLILLGFSIAFLK